MDRVFLIGQDQYPGTVRLQGGEDCRLCFVALPGCSEEVNVEVIIDGPSCNVELSGLYISKDEDKVDFHILMRHNCGGSISRQLFKGIVSGKARVGFDGLIYVARDAQKTKAYQENHTILLSPDARIETRPQLEIYADDVECSHGATTGFLREDELFYMRSRGIPEAEARRLQIISFLSPVLEKLPEELRQKVYESLD